MEIGEPKRVISVEPLEAPVPIAVPEDDDAAPSEPATPSTEPSQVPG